MRILLVSLVLFATAGTSLAQDETPRRPGSGFRVYQTDDVQINFRPYAYVRYLNQEGLDESYVDSFGNERSVDIRNDIQFNKVTLYFYGWFLDPKFRYLTYVWSANTSQGLGAQVVVAGNLSYRFNDMFSLAAGIGALPGVRTTEGNYPFWLSVDARLMADEYFRPSYTTGIWASGHLRDDLEYQLMVGNNLSQLGVDAAQLDDRMDTVSAMLVWMPTTGEYSGAFGDFEAHDELASRIGLHYTRSTENRQSQPGADAPENSQIRISDGNVVFTPFLFGPDISIIDVDYHMVSIDGGLKRDGYALEGEFYWRLVNDIGGNNVDQLPFDDLNDTGFQLQASAMLKPRTLQAYVGGSMIFGEYGDPSDLRVGTNWFMRENRSVRWNNELIFLDHSPTGALSLPTVVGGNGLVFQSNVEVCF